MTDDRFWQRLRADARDLRFAPDPFMATRIAARVRERILAPAPTAAQFLARWFRPMTATLTAIALAATFGLVWVERSVPDAAVESVSAAGNIEISAAGDVYSVGD